MLWGTAEEEFCDTLLSCNFAGKARKLSPSPLCCEAV
nr:MAG TPA: hypothetical protein [Bacteriophage sp.]